MRYIDLKILSSDITYAKGLNLNSVPITSGSVNDIACRFEFSDHWNDFTTKCAVFSGSETSRGVLIENDTAVIPWECLAKHGGELRVGVVGTVGEEGSDAYRILATEEISLGIIAYGADISSIDTEVSTPDLMEQIVVWFDLFKKQEDLREQNEAERKSAESTRILSETERTSAENDRQSNENDRQKNETLRLENETARENSEALRISSETKRLSNETARKANEEARLNSEKTRRENEETRQNNEEERITNETLRKNNDSIWQNNEKIRQENEVIREENEVLRVEAEDVRRKNYASFDNRLSLLEALSDIGIENATPGNISSFNQDGKLVDSGVSLSDLISNDALEEHISTDLTDDSGTHGLRLKDGIIQINQDGTWTNYTTANCIDTSVDPIFANNSWEKIANVAKYDDPSKYWKVGDYKDIEMRSLSITSVGELYSETGEVIENGVELYDNYLFLEAVGYIPGTYTVVCSSFPDVDIFRDDGSFVNSNEEGYCGLNFFNGSEGFTGQRFEVVVEEAVSSYPLQIIGFNHDTVTDKAAYGKAKAGLTLMLGCTRTCCGNRMGVYDVNIPLLSVSSDNKHIISPNKLAYDGTITPEGTNWANGGFRYYLAKHLDISLSEEIRNKIVTVNKISCNAFSAKNYYRDTAITQDKYFLMSEYEMYGEQICTKANEGEQYELFKMGYSKCIITPEMLDAMQIQASGYTNSRLWLRSVASRYVDKYIPSTNYFNPLSGYTENPDYAGDVSTYTNSLTMSYNGDSNNFNYYPGTARNNGSVPAYIAPCFCL